MSKAWLYGAAYSFILFIILRRITLINHVYVIALLYLISKKNLSIIDRGDRLGVEDLFMVVQVC